MLLGRDMSDHGFMSTACSLLNEQGWNWNAIERQLSHEERNNARVAHDYVQLMPERKKNGAGLGGLSGREQGQGQDHANKISTSLSPSWIMLIKQLHEAFTTG